MRILPVVFISLILGTASFVFGHESRPLHVEIKEKAVNTFAVQWKVPPSVPNINNPVVGLKGCDKAGEALAMRGAGGVLIRQSFNCSKGISDVSIEYPAFNPSVSTLVRVDRNSGEQFTRLLGPNEKSWTVPTEESTIGVAWDYSLLGIKHIWGGYDHLLFLVCLLFIAGTGRRIFITITGFTIAHSITLALSALNIVRVPVPPVEVVIALSIVFLATEIVKKRRETLTWKYPIAVSASFGLLHGFGFATVLSEIGLPQKEILTGLLFFNVGVEIGQIIFVIGVIALMKFMLSVNSEFKNPKLETFAAYVVGILASYWMIERVVGFLG